MRHIVSHLSCQEFQVRLPELIGSGGRIAEHAHVRSCELCQALLADLDAIANAARQLFPVEEPPDKLWGEIESAIVREEAASRGGR